MKKWPLILPVRALVVMLIVAFATTGLAHRLASPTHQAALEYAAIFGLDLSSICGNLDETGMPPDCQACRLHPAISLPDPAITVILAELSCEPADWTPHPPVLQAQTSTFGHPARAPPRPV
jgi:hypothetical protein